MRKPAPKKKTMPYKTGSVPKKKTLPYGTGRDAGKVASIRKPSGRPIGNRKKDAVRATNKVEAERNAAPRNNKKPAGEAVNNYRKSAATGRARKSAMERRNSKPVPLGMAKKKAAAERKKEAMRAQNKVKAQRGSASGKVGSAKSKNFKYGRGTI